MDFKTVVKILKDNGYVWVRTRGSHYRMKRGTQGVTIPIHKSIKVGILISIEKQSGVRIRY